MKDLSRQRISAESAASQVTGKRLRPGGDQPSDRIQGVQQCGRGDVGGDLIANRRGQPDDGPAS